MNRLIAAIFLLAAGASTAAGRDAPSGVVELFTSQGCSSCPAADKILLDLASAGEVIALGYHVDYWDYRGWKDTLGSPEFSERQQGYAGSLELRGVYTPQAVINGLTHVNGGDRSAIDRELAGLNKSDRGLAVDLSLREAGERIVIAAGAGEPPDHDVHLVLVFFDPAVEVRIESGANRGRTVTYANVVTGLQTAGMWDGKATSYELPRSVLTRKEGGGCAVLLQAVGQDGMPGRILGATVMYDR